MFDFSKIPFTKTAFSSKSFQLLRPEDKAPFAFMMEMIMLETGDAEARQNWQFSQFSNLLRHCSSRSKFWNNRLKKYNPEDLKITDLPVLLRQEAREQVESEGPLLTKVDGVEIIKHSTSGSTGTPLYFYASNSNVIYNNIRYFAQYLLDEIDLSMDRLYLNHRVFAEKNKFQIDKIDSYASYFSRVIQTGKNTNIFFNHFDKDKIIEFASDARAGLWVLGGPVSASLPSYFSAKDIYELGARQWITIGGPLDPLFRNELNDVGIKTTSNYSSEEIGLIGSECRIYAGYYHIASSSVIVEEGEVVEYEDTSLSKLLITHLSSYATPFIRYDIGDLGRVSQSCPCGHFGPTITKLVGRLSQSLLLRGGKRIPFHIRAREINKIAELTEYRVRQVDYDKIIFEAVLPNPNEHIRVKLVDFIENLVGYKQAIDVEVVFLNAIDWGTSVKKHTFRCEIN